MHIFCIISCILVRTKVLHTLLLLFTPKARVISVIFRGEHRKIDAELLSTFTGKNPLWKISPEGKIPPKEKLPQKEKKNPGGKNPLKEKIPDGKNPQKKNPPGGKKFSEGKNPPKEKIPCGKYPPNLT